MALVYYRSHCSPLSFYLLCALLLKMKHPQMQTSLSQNAKWGGYTWIRLVSTSLLCAAPLWSEAVFWGFFLIFKYTLVSLIPMATVGTPSSIHLHHHPSHLVMRRLGQNESKHSVAHKHTWTRCSHAYLWDPSFSETHANCWRYSRSSWSPSSFYCSLSERWRVIYF